VADSPADRPSQRTAAAPPDRRPYYQHLSTAASLTGLVVAFVAALGFPSAMFQYSRLGVPIDFLSYDRALRAGIVPTVVFLVANAVLFAATKLLVRWVRNTFQRESHPPAPEPTYRIILSGAS
jgi:hypothetical protein